MDSKAVSLIIGPIFILLGVGVIVFMGEKATLECYRLTANQINCNLTNASIRATQIQTFDNNQLQGADVVRYRDSDGDSTYSILLLTETENIPLTKVRSSGARGKRRKVEKINAFLADSEQQTLKVVQDERWFAFGLGGLFAVVGIGLTFSGIVAFL